MMLAVTFKFSNLTFHLTMMESEKNDVVALERYSTFWNWL